VLLIWYPKCTTCGKAEQWLRTNGFAFDTRDIKADNPTFDELKVWSEKSGLLPRKFFNTNGLLYKSMVLREKLGTMSTEEQLRLLATDGMLVKRPLLIDGDVVLVGFNEATWAERLPPRQ
jgi:arsenate reductase